MSTVIEAKRTNEVLRTPIPRAEVMDPLEGVMEGGTRFERYLNFHRGVLGKIWPPTSDSGEYGDDFHRPNRYDGRFDPANNPNWMSGYTQFSPTSRGPENLTPTEFETAVSNLGTSDYVRVRSVPGELTVRETNNMHTGGSCVIETWGVRTMTELRVAMQNGLVTPEVVADTARKLVNLAPSITHASGALLGGQSEMVHLIESDMWASRLENEFGVPHDEAQTETKAAYERINEIVKRRSKLINPDSTVLSVNFDELGLPQALSEWFSQMGLPYDPSFRIAEVIYTYMGPNELQLVQQALQRQLDSDGHNGPVRAAMERALQSDYHVREKQIDHLRWGSMDLPKDVIMGLREPSSEELEKMGNDPAFARGLIMMRDIYLRFATQNPQALAVGFADLPTFRNGVQHETRLNFSGKLGTPEETRTFLESVDQQFSNPARLHRNNVTEHLQFLRSYLADNSKEKADTIGELTKLQATLAPLKKAQQGVDKAHQQFVQQEQSVAENQRYLTLSRTLTEGKVTHVKPTELEMVKKMRTSAEKSLQNAQRKVEEGSADDMTRADVQRLPEVVAYLDSLLAGSVPVQSGSVVEYMGGQVRGAEKMEKELGNKLSEKQKALEVAQGEFVKVQAALPHYLSDESRMGELKKKLESLNMQAYFPLSDNPFVHHAMQFLWDPDFATLLRELVSVQEARSTKQMSKDDSNRSARELMRKVYPKLESYIRYLYGQTEYPEEMRNSQLLTN